MFDGVKLAINKGISQHFQVSHTLAINSTAQNGYRFGVTYVGDQKLGTTDMVPVLLGDTDSSGNLNGQIIHQIGPFRTRFLTHVSLFSPIRKHLVYTVL